MSFVYSLCHINPCSYEKNIDLKDLGAFDSLEKITEGVAYYRKRLGFKDFPSTFFMTKLDIGKRYWNNGFSSRLPRHKNALALCYLRDGLIPVYSFDFIDRLPDCPKKIPSIYKLKHEYCIQEGVSEERYLGVFSNVKEVMDALDYYKLLPGFREALEGFEVTKNIVNKRYWLTGFRNDLSSFGLYQSKKAKR